MWIINLLIVIVILLIFFYCEQQPKEWLQTMDRKEHKLSWLYPMAYWLFDKIGIKKVIDRKDATTLTMKAIYVTNKPEPYMKLFWCKKIAQVLLVVFIFQVLSLLGWMINANESIIIEGRYIIRPNYGEGEATVNLDVAMERIDTSTGSKPGSRKTHEVTLDIEERLYAKEEVNVLFEEAFAYLKKDILGKNKNFEVINDNLVFSNHVPGTSIMVDWIPEDYSLIEADGTVRNEKMEEEGRETNLTIILTYHDYRKEYTLPMHIMPKEYSKEELIQQELEEAIIKKAQETAYDERFQLPEALTNYRLEWKDVKNNSYIMLFFLGILLAILLWIWQDKELEKQLKLRSEQMLMDYPEVIHKFTLLVNAGMTIKQAWYKISEDYSNRSSKNGFHKHYVYEEMLATVNELKVGISEHVAYKEFGRRIGLINYIKFSSLLSQNLKKGTKGFTELLMHEAREAFEERKETAKRLGEEAGTKLIFPMMIMLLIILLMIMIPAFLTLGM